MSTLILLLALEVNFRAKKFPPSFEKGVEDVTERESLPGATAFSTTAIFPAEEESRDFRSIHPDEVSLLLESSVGKKISPACGIGFGEVSMGDETISSVSWRFP